MNVLKIDKNKNPDDNFLSILLFLIGDYQRC